MSNTRNYSTEESNREEDYIEFEGEQRIKERMERLKHLKRIKTARGADAINKAVDEGYTPLIYEVKPSEKMYVKEVLIRDIKTGKVKTMPYYFYVKLYGIPVESDSVKVVSYDPYKFPPYAAYLLPNDLEKGETVILEDLIEDIVGASHNGYVMSRQNNAEAVWDGEKFIIDRNSFDTLVTIG